MNHTQLLSSINLVFIFETLVLNAQCYKFCHYEQGAEL